MDIFIYGTGGHAKVVLDTVDSMTGYQVVCFVDDQTEKSEYLGLPVLKTPEAIKLTKTGIVAIGANHIREKVASEIVSINANVNFVSAIHSSSVVSSAATVRPGSVIMAGVIINSGAIIEPHCVVNSGSIIEHDCVLKGYSSVAPGAVLGGEVHIGKRSFISLGVQIKHGVHVGDDTVIGMGSSVINNISSLKVAYGSPCKEVRSRAINDNYL